VSHTVQGGPLPRREPRGRLLGRGERERGEVSR
jgi:hypothetical protein